MPDLNITGLSPAMVPHPRYVLAGEFGDNPLLEEHTSIVTRYVRAL
ncbi:hypothetical protein K7472_29480 [Streptomyces sp. PTM05]|uniref:Uncharacterized protein n=1 Tax=Streptantibioticus parmotrematis TaxID=2873249 RepID=A0ABS7R194_9ACTN|nr:hypothetical protein [Streptantibioticus parmotrematis]MBY8888948.1 hypothetical protein [Streptantibioticus parmotrematis]